jgi:hypothetical protein
VRRAELTYEAANASNDHQSTENSSEDEENSLRHKFPSRESRQMAVKLQSKYKLIKNK